MIKKWLSVFRRYGFLLSQLVKRDFKTKYRRSVLGVLWSLLNPMLVMLVQYIVFSTIFRFDLENYAVYLLSGIVVFNYMSDATSQAMNSIVQNAMLINKVYVPKYIYPFSRVLSSGVNFLFSLAALYIMILASGLSLTLNHFFLLYAIICLFVFICGLSMFLSAVLVFFRDTQFLYSVALSIWMYLTPIFYPVTILPDNVLFILKFNPLYHIIKFIRSIILDNMIPPYYTWLYCAGFAAIAFVIGAMVFKKTQSKFILYL